MSITKEKQYIILDYGKGKYTIDCATKALYNKANKPISKGSAQIMKQYALDNKDMSTLDTLVYLIIKKGVTENDIKALEILFSAKAANMAIRYTIDDICYMVSKGCDISEKGYIPYCIENNVVLSKRTYDDFMIQNTVNNLQGIPGDTMKIFLQNFPRRTQNSREVIAKSIRHLSNNIDHVKALIKIINHTSYLEYLCYEPVLINAILENQPYIDTSISYNENVRMCHKKAKEQAAIIKWACLADILPRISDIETIENEEYQVVVPRNILDLMEEGNRQCNCVGSYYNDSIQEGETYIYFIRKKSDPTKNYVTCEFDVSELGTVQLKTAHNNGVPADVFIFARTMIDPTIVNILMTKYLDETVKKLNPTYY